MQIRSLPIRPSILQIAVFVFFVIFVIWYIQVTGENRILIWAGPTLVLLLIIPMILTYMSQKEYEGLIPVYEAEARGVKIREINEKMISKPVKLEGLVEEVRFRSLNRPHFIIADRTGTIPVKMFTSPREDIRPGDVVEVLGQVIHRFIVTGDPVINGVNIRVIRKKDVKDKQK
ncbi:MAG: nucleotide-binding protein [Methanomicrobiales archaeon HGW-Methanomicrobiales-4]|nr:MAG: nucleotide-binding protein [Methanomicrobiales archaeon HGW-Methanomicrobiales-4]